MKVRSGFVSNSSSSSFILKFDKVPKTKEEMRILLFGEKPPAFVAHWGDDAVSTEQVANILFKDVEKAHFSGINDLIDSVKSEIEQFGEYTYDDGYGFVEGTEHAKEFDKLYDGISKFEKTVSDIRYKPGFDWQSHSATLNKMSEPMFDLIEKALRERYNESDSFMEVEYSDSDGQIFSYMEHSGILDKIAVQRFSHH